MRGAILPLLALSMAVLAGCQPVQQHEAAAPLQQRPIEVDQAMQHRDWPVSVATIPSGGIVGNPTLLAFEPAQNLEPPLNGQMFDVPTFVLNVGLMPLMAISQGIWTPTAYHGVNLPASYTWSPAYPADLPKPKRHHALGAEADAPMARHVSPTTQRAN